MRIAMLAVLAGMTVLLHAQQPATDPAAENALARMEAAYQTVAGLHIKVRWSAKYSAGMAEDFPLLWPDTLELRMQRPNKLFLSASSKRFGSRSSYLVVSDGTTLSYWRSWTNTYYQTEAPATLAGIGRLVPNDVIGTDVDGTWESQNIAEWDLLTDDQGPSMVKAIAESGGILTMTGPEKLGNAPVNGVRMTSWVTDAFTLTLEQRFLLDAELYLLRGHAMSARGKHPETGRDSTFDMQGRYDVFSARPTFSEADFRFVAPRGARPESSR